MINCSSRLVPTKISNKVCLFTDYDNPICMPLSSYELLQEKVKVKFNLNYKPNIDEIRELLSVSQHIKIHDRIRDFLSNEGIDSSQIGIMSEFRVRVPNIDNYGLSGRNVFKIYDILKTYYPFFHYRGPCLLDYNKYKYTNYSNFQLYPLFSSNGIEYDVYNILMLTVNSSDDRAGHWVSVCVVKNSIIYYDSLNEEIAPEFRQLIGIIMLELKTIYNDVLIWRNKKQLQYDGKYCGVFQLHFLTVILELYSKNLLFKCYNDNIYSLNEEALEYYLETGIKQETIERLVAKIFYKN